jgi:hypothetical protein
VWNREIGEREDVGAPRGSSTSCGASRSRRVRKKTANSREVSIVALIVLDPTGPLTGTGSPRKSLTLLSAPSTRRLES